MKLKFVANGFERWKQVQDAGFRKTIRDETADGSRTLSILEEARLWFKTELGCGKKNENKSSPKILW